MCGKYSRISKLERNLLCCKVGSDQTRNIAWPQVSQTLLYWPEWRRGSSFFSVRRKKKVATSHVNLVTGACVRTLAATFDLGEQFNKCKQVNPLTTYGNFLASVSPRLLIFGDWGQTARGLFLYTKLCVSVFNKYALNSNWLSVTSHRPKFTSAFQREIGKVTKFESVYLCLPARNRANFIDYTWKCAITNVRSDGTMMRLPSNLWF